MCRSALGESRLPGYDYCLNPYVGCSHACIYCYARSYAVRHGRTERWGSYVDVKQNIVEVLEKEVRGRLRRGVVGISTLTDAYQPVESARCLTKRCLKLLLENGFHVVIQTKSDLVLRDIEFIAKYRDEVSLGVTITTLDKELARQIEPRASDPERRIEVLSRAGSVGLGTWIFIGPIMPYLTDVKITELLDVAQSIKVGEVLFDRLNMRPGVWSSVSSFLRDNYPELLPKYEEIFYKNTHFYQFLKELLGAEAAKRGLKYSFCY
ncbi:MAG: radical SAM protein [Thermoproteota archaeon]